jgi:hypothetical protein
MDEIASLVMFAASKIQADESYRRLQLKNTCRWVPTGRWLDLTCKPRHVQPKEHNLWMQESGFRAAR